MKTIYQVEITQTAEKDIHHIWEYIAQDTKQAANRFIAELDKQFTALTSNPERCASIPENALLKTNYKHLIYKQYRMIFRIEKQQVYILRIIHGTKLLVIK